MSISSLMVHVQKVEESCFFKKSMEAKKAKSYEGGSSKGRLDIQDKSRFKRSFSSKVPKNFPKDRDNKLFTLCLKK